MAATARTVAAGACIAVLCAILFAGAKIKGKFPSFPDEVASEEKERGGATTEAEMLDRLMGEAETLDHGAGVAAGADAGRSLHGTHWVHRRNHTIPRDMPMLVACKDDMIRFCLVPNQQSGRARNPFNMSCLKWHMAELTPSCSSKLSTLEARMPMAAACREDLTRLCLVQKQQGGRAFNPFNTSCLQAHMAELSPLCSSKFSKLEARRKELEIRRTCASKVKELCGSQPLGQRRACFQQHIAADEKCRPYLVSKATPR